MRVVILAVACIALSGCVAGYGASGGLVGGQSPPNPYAANAEPQVPNSLPEGARGQGPSGPNSRFPDFGALTVGSHY